VLREEQGGLEEGDPSLEGDKWVSGSREQSEPREKPRGEKGCNANGSYPSETRLNAMTLKQGAQKPQKKKR